MVRGRKKELTDIERKLLKAGLVASLRGRRDRFWAAEAQKMYQELFQTSLSWGTILPALRRMEDTLLLSADWVTEDPRRRPLRYYSLTQRGKEEASAAQAPVSTRAGLGVLPRPLEAL